MWIRSRKNHFTISIRDPRLTRLATPGCHFTASGAELADIAMPPNVILSMDAHFHLKSPGWRNRHGMQKHAFTYTEPTVFLSKQFRLLDLLHAGIANIYVTNGYMSMIC